MVFSCCVVACPNPYIRDGAKSEIYRLPKEQKNMLERVGQLTLLEMQILQHACVCVHGTRRWLATARRR